MMEPALAVFHPQTTVAEATQELRHLVKTAFITYLFVVDQKRASRRCGRDARDVAGTAWSET